jgi:hypothetical protein
VPGSQAEVDISRVECPPGDALVRADQPSGVVSPNAFSKSVIRRPDSDSQKVTRCDQATGSGAAARNASATPQRRRCSIVRTFVVFARGRRCETAARGSITTHSIPCRPSSAAAASSAGPPPTTSTAVLVAQVAPVTVTK